MDAPPQFTAGTLIGGDFRIQRPLSAGGMGAVYVAEQLSTGKPRALKLMHPQLVTDPKSRLRFIEEARVGARIPSEHVVEVVGAGVDDATGVPWLAMELLEGEELTSLVERSGPLPTASAHELMLQLGHGLGAAHTQGIVHRDLKPENVFMTKSRRRGAELTVKVLDFGIAKTLESNRTAATATAAMGSPLFMAPEQATPGAAIRPETDVWALGLIALYALTGHYYWQSAVIEPFSLQALLGEVLVHPMPPATERLREIGAAVSLPPGFDAWFARCVARDPRMRFSDASACVGAFDAMMQGNLHSSMQGQMPVGRPAPQVRGTPALGAYTPAPVARTAHMQPATPAPGTSSVPAYAAPVRQGGGFGLVAVAVAGAGLLALLGVGGVVAAVGLGEESAPLEVAAPPAPPAPTLPEPARPIAPTPLVPIRPRERPTPPPIAEAEPPPIVEAEPPPLVEEAVLAPHEAEPTRPDSSGGRLSISTMPWSTISIDGRRVGNTPIVNLAVAPGRHRIRAETSDGRTETWTQVVREGQTARVSRRLREPERPAPREVPAEPTGPSAPPGAPQSPSQGDVASAMRSVAAPVRACNGNGYSSTPVRVTFSGATGRVSNVDVNADRLSPAVVSCIERAVRAAHVPPFQDRSFTVNYPFRI